MLVAQLCPTFCNPTDCSPPGSPVHAILQARILEWVAILFSRVPSWPRDQTQFSALQVDSLPSQSPEKPNVNAMCVYHFFLAIKAPWWYNCLNKSSYTFSLLWLKWVSLWYSPNFYTCIRKLFFLPTTDITCCILWSSQSIRSQRVGHRWVTEHSAHSLTWEIF